LHSFLAHYLKMQAIHSCETSVNFYWGTQDYISEQSTLHSHQCEILKFNNIILQKSSIFKESIKRIRNTVSVVTVNCKYASYNCILKEYHSIAPELERPLRPCPGSATALISTCTRGIHNFRNWCHLYSICSGAMQQ
jgi:hypothetical protein